MIVLVLCLSWILIALAHTLIALAPTLIALTHLNSTEKMHRLNCCQIPTVENLATLQCVPRKGFGSADNDTIYTSMYAAVHNQLTRTFLEAHIVPPGIQRKRPGAGVMCHMYTYNTFQEKSIYRVLGRHT